MSSNERPTVLVVDHDSSVADQVARHLEGYAVVPVQNANQLETAVALHHPRAVIWNCEPGVPCVAGICVAQSVPVIECSLPSQSWLADSLAVQACLTKPVTGERLLAVIDRLGAVRDILVIDDDRDFCQLVERIVATSPRAYRARRAYSGADGLEAMRAHRPDLLLLDLVMPGMDGLRVLRELRADPDLADLPVVLLTATTLAEDLLEQRSNQVTIRRSQGLRPAEVMRCIQAIVGVLQPHYTESPGTMAFTLSRNGQGQQAGSHD